ncbi:hypothetical protein QJS66_07125 [Kocuria rhizophila]|nr:hypothetical protein QJS66_07125 [Kocuria rhizophila]
MAKDLDLAATALERTGAASHGAWRGRLGRDWWRTATRADFCKMITTLRGGFSGGVKSLAGAEPLSAATMGHRLAAREASVQEELLVQRPRGPAHHVQAGGDSATFTARRSVLTGSRTSPASSTVHRVGDGRGVHLQQRAGPLHEHLVLARELQQGEHLVARSVSRGGFEDPVGPAQRGLLAA